jgi:hypothetical protein
MQQSQIVISHQQAQAVASHKHVAISDLMGLLSPGMYCLGQAQETGRLVVVSPRVRIVLAVAMQGSGLSYLGYTAAATALRNGHRLGVVTERPGAWPGAEEGVSVFAPSQFQYLVQQLRENPQTVRSLVVLDKLTLAWGLSPADVASLTENPAVSTLVLTRPGRKARPEAPEPPARMLLAGLPEAYMHDGARAPYLMPVYGMGDESLSSIQAPARPLAYGQFIMRHKSAWLLFATATKE